MSLIDSQSTVPSDTVHAIKNLCKTFQDKNDQPFSRSKSAGSGYKNDSSPPISDDESCLGEADCSKSNQKKFKPPSSKRQQLTSVEAAEIFELRPRSKGKGLRRGSMLICKTIAPKYGVSPKTVRDIWRGRTWLHATEHLWTEEDKKIKPRQDANSGACSHISEAPIDQKQCKDVQRISPSPTMSSTICAHRSFQSHPQPAPLAAQSSVPSPAYTASWLQHCSNPSTSYFPSCLGGANPPMRRIPSVCTMPCFPRPQLATAPPPPALDPAFLRLLACGGLNPIPRQSGMPCAVAPGPAAYGGFAGSPSAGLGWMR